MSKPKNNWLALIGFVLGVELVGNIGSLATFSQITTWYLTLNKPAFNPPSWIFGPVWTILFALMGLAAYLVYQNGINKKNVRAALMIFSVQMILNVLWSFVFFGWHLPDMAFVEILLLWIAIAATILEFEKISKPAAWLLIPYLFWVTFASFLTLAVWQLN